MTPSTQPLASAETLAAAGLPRSQTGISPADLVTIGTAGPTIAVVVPKVHARPSSGTLPAGNTHRFEIAVAPDGEEGRSGLQSSRANDIRSVYSSRLNDCRRAGASHPSPAGSILRKEGIRPGTWPLPGSRPGLGIQFIELPQSRTAIASR